jgi:hypothetical protein
LKQLFCIATIERKTQRLAIGFIGSVPIWPLLPVNSQPFKIFKDLIDKGVSRSLCVRIFDPEDERSLPSFGKEIVKDGSSSVSNVEKPGRRRGEADPNM